MPIVKKPLLVIATVLALFIVLAEVGSSVFMTASSVDPDADGIGIRYMVLVDGALFVTLMFLMLSLFVSARLMGIIYGISNLIIFLVVFISSILMIIFAIIKLTMLVTLFLAVPFGTLIYLAGFGDFDVGGSRALLGVIILLKFAVALCLIFAHPSYLTIKSLVFLVLCSLLVNLVVMILHGVLVPSILVSITDAIAAIVVAIVGAIWALWKTIGAIPAALKGLRLDRHVLGS